MSRQIICTVGTSLLTNRDERPWQGWNPGTPDSLPDTARVESWLRTADPVKASAETNTLRALELNDTDALALLHSDTTEGRFCAERLAAYYDDGRCREVGCKRIGELGYGADVFTRGLKALVNVTLAAIRDGRDRRRQPVLCATGGFKAEIAFLNLLGALFEIEVVYIHELHGELVHLPRLPLAWDAEFVRQREEFFNWIDAEPRPSQQVESRLKGQPELRSLVEHDGEGYSYLTAAGDLLFKAAGERLGTPRATWPEAAVRQPSEKNMVSTTDHHRPQGWERFVNHLCDIDCVTFVRYDAAAHGGLHVKIIDAAEGVLAIRYGTGGNELPLRVETTARGDAQSELVANYLQRFSTTTRRRTR